MDKVTGFSAYKNIYFCTDMVNTIPFVDANDLYSGYDTLIFSCFQVRLLHRDYTSELVSVKLGEKQAHAKGSCPKQ